MYQRDIDKKSKSGRVTYRACITGDSEKGPFTITFYQIFADGEHSMFERATKKARTMSGAIKAAQNFLIGRGGDD